MMSSSQTFLFGKVFSLRKKKVWGYLWIGVRSLAFLFEKRKAVAPQKKNGFDLRTSCFFGAEPSHLSF